MTSLVVLDNEAVQALRRPQHRKHRRVLALIEVVATRKRRSEPVHVVVPTTVRVDAGWDRRDPTWALPNRLAVRDVTLDTAAADVAARLRAEHGVSVADAHVGAVVAAAAGSVTVLTSDPRDIRAVTAAQNVTIVVI